MSSIDVICRQIGLHIQNSVSTPITAYPAPTSVNSLPAVVVEPANADFLSTFNRGRTQWDLHLFVLCSMSEMAVGQKSLRAYIDIGGPDSIPRILNSSDVPGLDDTDVACLGMHGYGGSFESADVQIQGAILSVRAITDGRP